MHVFHDSGHHPILINRHPNRQFNAKLHAATDDSQRWVLDADLGELSEDLEGRSNNPIALLADSLLFPLVDMGWDVPSCVRMQYR